jgi:hypothetical protein
MVFLLIKNNNSTKMFGRNHRCYWFWWSDEKEKCAGFQMMIYPVPHTHGKVCLYVYFIVFIFGSFYQLVVFINFDITVFLHISD